jgi:hypothetical protein
MNLIVFPIETGGEKSGSGAYYSINLKPLKKSERIY